MTTTAELLAGINSIALESEVKSAIALTSDDYVNMQKAQMLQGKNRKGKDLWEGVNPVPYVSKWYARKKASMNTFLAGKQPHNVDLKLTGDFHKGLKMQVEGSDVSVFSEDGKAGKLEGRFGSEIYGLNDNAKNIYVTSFAFPVFANIIQKITGLKLKY